MFSRGTGRRKRVLLHSVCVAFAEVFACLEDGRFCASEELVDDTVTALDGVGSVGRVPE